MKKYLLVSGWLANITLISILMLGVLLTAPERASAAPTQPLAAPCTSTSHPPIPAPPQRPSWSPTTWHFGWFATCSEATWQFYIGSTTSGVGTSAVGVDIDMKCGGSTQSVTVSLYDANDQVINSINAPCNSTSSQQLAIQNLKTGVKYRVNYDQTVQNVAASYVVYSWPVNPSTQQFNPAPKPPPTSGSPTGGCPAGLTTPSGESCVPMSNCPSGYGYVAANQTSHCLTAPTSTAPGNPPAQTAAFDDCMNGYVKENGSLDGGAALTLCDTGSGLEFYHECMVGGGTVAICGAGPYTLLADNNFDSGGSPAHSNTFDAEYIKTITITGTLQCQYSGSVSIDIFSNDKSATPFSTSTGISSCGKTGTSWNLPATAVPAGIKTISILMSWNGNAPGSGGPTDISGSYTVTGTGQ